MSTNVALRQPLMTRDQFFDWAQAQEARYEFDGFQPVAMTGGSNNHNTICHNIWSALRSRLRGTNCSVRGPDAGLATVGDAVRYPNALVTCARIPGAARLVPDAVVVFEVLSPSSGRADWVDKLREYRAVPSIRRYVVLQYDGTGLTVFSRADGAAGWAAAALTGDETLDLPELGISVPVQEFYEDVDLPGTAPATES